MSASRGLLDLCKVIIYEAKQFRVVVESYQDDIVRQGLLAHHSNFAQRDPISLSVHRVFERKVL